ncbi:hypothetical protein VTN77DRAFT_5934 [Rasamsonia byssochlamydoides]|uniref:uncharacterized protein n=1 Tax=Rasamsonia byssochlamydoides TaxID=89139 RepID=UPI003743F9DE
MNRPRSNDVLVTPDCRSACPGSYPVSDPVTNTRSRKDDGGRSFASSLVINTPYTGTGKILWGIVLCDRQEG